VICGAKHPEIEGVTCTIKRPQGTHSPHTDWEHPPWLDKEFEERRKLLKSNRKVKPGAKARLHTKVVNSRKENLEAELRRVSPGVPQEAEGKWQQDPWVTYAGQTFQRFLEQRPESFTTAEDVWPLLERPEEMRAMVQVVRRLLRAGYMEEVGAKRLKGVYRTKDGHEFAENKLVPIYRSLIASTDRVTTSDCEPGGSQSFPLREDTSISGEVERNGPPGVGVSHVGRFT
jgi:hypothetical protein